MERYAGWWGGVGWLRGLQRVGCARGLWLTFACSISINSLDYLDLVCQSNLTASTEIFTIIDGIIAKRKGRVFSQGVQLWIINCYNLSVSLACWLLRVFVERKSVVTHRY